MVNVVSVITPITRLSRLLASVSINYSFVGSKHTASLHDNIKYLFAR